MSKQDGIRKIDLSKNIEVRIPSKKSLERILLFGMLFLGLTIGVSPILLLLREAFVSGELVSQPIFLLVPSLILFIGCLGFVGYLMGYCLLKVLWTMWGKEHVLLNVQGKTLALRKELFGQGWTRHYDTSNMQNLRTLYWAEGSLLFEYGAKTICFGEAMELEQKQLFESILQFMIDFSEECHHFKSMGFPPFPKFLEPIQASSEVPPASSASVWTDHMIQNDRWNKKRAAWGILLAGSLVFFGMVLLSGTENAVDRFFFALGIWLVVIWMLLCGYALICFSWGIMLKKEGLLVYWTPQRQRVYAWDDIVIGTTIGKSNSLGSVIYVKEARWSVFTYSFYRMVGLSTNSVYELHKQIYTMKYLHGKHNMSLNTCQDVREERDRMDHKEQDQKGR